MNTLKLVVGALFFLIPSLTFAASGACSDHGGVDCSAGAGDSGQVICRDGWTGSSVSYASMAECQPQPTTDSNSAFQMKQQCASYTNAIQNEISNADVSSEENEEIHPGNSVTTTLGEVFYSPITNSCLYTETTIIKSTPTVIDGKSLDISGTTYSINDYLDNDSQVYAVVQQAGDTSSSKIDAFDQKVAYYKGSTAQSRASSNISGSSDTDFFAGASAPTPTHTLKGYTIGTQMSSTSTNTPTVSATNGANRSTGILNQIYNFFGSLFSHFVL